MIIYIYCELITFFNLSIIKLIIFLTLLLEMGFTDINEIKEELTNKYTIYNDRIYQSFKKVMDSNLNDFEENIKNLYLSIKESEIIKFIEKEFPNLISIPEEEQSKETSPKNTMTSNLENITTSKEKIENNVHHIEENNIIKNKEKETIQDHSNLSTEKNININKDNKIEIITNDNMIKEKNTNEYKDNKKEIINDNIQKYYKSSNNKLKVNYNDYEEQSTMVDSKLNFNNNNRNISDISIKTIPKINTNDNAEKLKKELMEEYEKKIRDGNDDEIIKKQEEIEKLEMEILKKEIISLLENNPNVKKKYSKKNDMCEEDLIKKIKGVDDIEYLDRTLDLIQLFIKLENL